MSDETKMNEKSKTDEVDEGHTYPYTYTLIALAVLTLIEVGVGALPSSTLVTVILIVLAIAKASLVAGIFMHIAYEKEILSILMTVFILPLISVVILILIIHFDWRIPLVIPA